MNKKPRGSLSDFAAKKGESKTISVAEGVETAHAPIAVSESAEFIPAGMEPDEQQRLAALEQVIQKNIQAFYEVGSALREIRDGKLYKTLGYNRFEDYCEDRWDISRIHAYRLEAASNVIDNLKMLPSGLHFLPSSERQVRALAALPPEQQRQTWEKVIETAPRVQEKPKITAKLVEDTVAELTGQVKTPKDKPAGVRASFHFSEELDDALNESLYRVKKLVGKDKKTQVSKDLIAEAILQHGLEELQAQGEDSPLWQAIVGKLG